VEEAADDKKASISSNFQPAQGGVLASKPAGRHMSSCNPPSPTLFSPFTDEESRKRKIEYITNEIAKRRIIEEENYKLKHDLEVLRELNTALQQQLARLGTEKIQSLTVR
jgi:hypothetical protein